MNYTMQNRKSRTFRSVTIILVITSLLICIACNVFESNRFYFATSVNGESTLGCQYLADSSSFQYDFAGEETLRSATSSQSNLNHSLLRAQRNHNQSQIILALFLVTAILILTNILRSYGFLFCQEKCFSSVRIAGFIEHSDGKK